MGGLLESGARGHTAHDGIQCGHSLVVWPWASYLTFLGSSLRTGKTGVTSALTSKSSWETEQDNIHSALKRVPALPYDFAESGHHGCDSCDYN